MRIFLSNQTKATPKDHGSESFCVASVLALFFGKNFGLLTKYVCVEIAFEEFNYLMKLTCLQISSTALSFL